MGLPLVLEALMGYCNLILGPKVDWFVGRGDYGEGSCDLETGFHECAAD